MAQYYFVVTSLPILSFDSQPDMTFEQFLDLLKLNLSSKDFAKIKTLLFLIDLINIRALWLGLPFDIRGNFSAKELEEALLTKEGLSSDLVEFLDRYDTSQERLKYFSSLYASFFARASQEEKGFLKKYFVFEREFRLILTGLRAKEMNRDPVRSA